MYAQPVMHGMRARGLFTILGVFVALLLIALSLKASTQESNWVLAQATGLKPVAGYIYMADGTTPAAGATVVVTMWNGTTLRSTLTTTSDSTGLYAVTFGFGSASWEVGDLIVVGATLGFEVGEANAVADSSPIQYINVVVGTAIPEFGAPIALVTAAVAIVVLAAIRRRS